MSRHLKLFLSLGFTQLRKKDFTYLHMFQAWSPHHKNTHLAVWWMLFPCKLTWSQTSCLSTLSSSLCFLGIEQVEKVVRKFITTSGLNLNHSLKSKFLPLYSKQKQAQLNLADGEKASESNSRHTYTTQKITFSSPGPPVTTAGPNLVKADECSGTAWEWNWWCNFILILLARSNKVHPVPRSLFCKKKKCQSFYNGTYLFKP